MTQNLTNLGPKIALFEPDIPQNTAAIIRTCACLGAKLEIIEPCGFLISDKRFKRVVMDYLNLSKITRYSDFEAFQKKNAKSRIILMTTKAKKVTGGFELNGSKMWTGTSQRQRPGSFSSPTSRLGSHAPRWAISSRTWYTAATATA